MSARLLIVEHEAICPPGRLGAWLGEAGVEVDVVRPYAGDSIPESLDHDGLVVLGGTMGANDDASHPWLRPTKRLLRDAVGAAVPVLGVCLGHQLLAVACGGQVRPNPTGTTIGLRTVEPTGAGDDRLFGGDLTGAMAVHWNDDVVTTLPPGAVVLATTPDGAPQVMRLGQRAWGVQFHPEADSRIVSVWADRTVADGELSRADADAQLAEIEAADDAVSASWQPWARQFAEIVINSPGAAPR